MSTRARQLLSATLLSGSMILAVANASADETILPLRSYNVSYADLNLSEPQDVETLYGRIRNAAKHVCAREGRLTLGKVVRERECRAEAISDAIAQVRDAKLAALHRGKGQQG